MSDRYDEVTAALVASARRAADRLDEDRSRQAASDASHALRTLANMVEQQHNAFRALAGGLRSTSDPTKSSDPESSF